MESIQEIAERAVVYYNEINKANFTDSMDVIVVRQKDGTLRSTPFYVRFGKRDILKPKENIITLKVNNITVDEILMMLDESGEGFFVEDSKDAQNSFSKVSSKICLAGNHIEETKSVPAFNIIEPQKVDDYLKAANTLKEFFVVKQDEETPSQEENDSCLKAPKFYIDSSSSINLLKYNNPGSCYSLESQDSAFNDSELQKLRDKVVMIEKSKFLKNINLSSEKLELLDLKPGLNEITYILKNSPKEDKISKANIFLWESTDKIVISDIDGTITKSDLRGHIMSMIGRDWYQDGVVDLFNSIEKNGYKIIYLSARPICQCELTRGLIRNLTQKNCSMPISAVLVNPVDFLNAFQLELIDKSPEEFKINCLSFIRTLFDDNDKHDIFGDTNPFCAGFGNKPSDELTYKAVRINPNSIFLINSSGKIVNNSVGISELSYSAINRIVDEFFPKLK